MANSNKRPMAVFPIRKLKKIGSFILRIRTILINILNNPTIFVSPSPAVATITTNVTNLEAAEAIARTRVIGSVAARNLKYDVVLKNVHTLQSYVQGLADNAVDEHTSIAIINASGFDLKNKGVRVKPDLAVENAEISGSVQLVAKSAGRRSAYEWRKSADNVTWADLPSTLQAKTTVHDLPLASTMYFQYRAILKEGVGNWSQSVNIIVQ
jgi:hypothetical protein